MADKKIKYPIARQHQLLQVAPQFKPVRRGAREKAVENVYTTKDKKQKVTIRMFKQLDIADQDLLLTILAIALPVSRGRVTNGESENNTELWGRMEAKGIFADREIIYIETTPFELLRELGKNTGSKDYAWLRGSLVRMMNTSIELETEKKIGGTNLLSYEIDKDAEKIKIAVNSINAFVLMNDERGYVLHNRNERLELKYDVAKALHAVLVGMVRIKSNATYRTDMLVEKVYNESDIMSLDKDTRKNRRKAIDKALSSINKLENWEIVDFGNDTVKITRRWEKDTSKGEQRSLF